MATVCHVLGFTSLDLDKVEPNEELDELEPKEDIVEVELKEEFELDELGIAAGIGIGIAIALWILGLETFRPSVDAATSFDLPVVTVEATVLASIVVSGALVGICMRGVVAAVIFASEGVERRFKVGAAVELVAVFVSKEGE